MSRVGITGLIGNLPGTVTPYPTQDPALELGGYRSVLDTTARNAIPANFRALGMQVTTTSDTKTWQLVGGLLDANWQQVQGQAPFKGSYYVDPAFAGVQTGSQSNPFTTFAAAFAAMTALSLAGGIVRIPPGITVTENVVFPDTGGDWEIASDVAYFGNSSGSRITGTVTATTTVAVNSSFRCTNLILNGAVSGDIANAAGLANLTFNRCRGTSTLNLTTSGGVSPAVRWVVKMAGAGVAEEGKWAGSFAGAVTVAGDLVASNWTFDGTVSYAPGIAQFNAASVFQNCWFNVGGITNTGIAGSFTRLVDCAFQLPVTFTTTNASNLQVDGASMASLQEVGLTLAGAATTLTTKNSNASDTRTVAGNVGARSYGARNAPGLYVVDFDLTLVTPGGAGSSGLLQLNAVYTDVTGTLVTVPVGSPLDITGATDSKQQGALRFQHNGAATPIAYSLTGIVTPGAMSVAVATALQRRN